MKLKPDLKPYTSVDDPRFEVLAIMVYFMYIVSMM